MNISQKVVLSSIGSFIYNNGDWNDEFEKYADDYYGTEYNKAIERLPSDFREIYSNSEPENFATGIWAISKSCRIAMYS